MKNIIIFGGKKINLDIKDIIYSFDTICRINLNLQLKNSSNKDIFYVNHHINQNMVKKRITQFSGRLSLPGSSILGFASSRKTRIVNMKLHLAGALICSSPTAGWVDT